MDDPRWKHGAQEGQSIGGKKAGEKEKK